ncbi:hypothetical protein GCM10020256_73340 [Streptomyces thermocoprophilus]
MVTSPAEGGSARVACRVPELLGAGGATGEATGALWKLAESGRQLDANVVRLAPGTRVAPHVEPDLDVLLVVVAGDGMLDGGEVPRGADGGRGGLAAARQHTRHHGGR